MKRSFFYFFFKLKEIKNRIERERKRDFLKKKKDKYFSMHNKKNNDDEISNMMVVMCTCVKRVGAFEPSFIRALDKSVRRAEQKGMQEWEIDAAIDKAKKKFVLEIDEDRAKKNKKPLVSCCRRWFLAYNYKRKTSPYFYASDEEEEGGDETQEASGNQRGKRSPPERDSFSKNQKSNGLNDPKNNKNTGQRDDFLRPYKVFNCDDSRVL